MMPEGSDIYSVEEGQRLNERAEVHSPAVKREFHDSRTEEQKKPGPNYVPIGGAGNGGN